MLSVSQTAGYAIMALCCLDPECQKMVLARDIAEQTGIPKPYLSKMLNQLQHAGLIIGKRGYKGGLILTRPAGEITMLDVVVIVDGEDWCRKCFLGLPGCGSGQPCPMHDFWGDERMRIETMLRDMKLDSLHDFKKEGWRLN